MSFRYITAFLLASMLCQQTMAAAPLTVTKSMGDCNAYGKCFEVIKIVSKSNRLEIKDIILNRGNCQPISKAVGLFPKLPATVKFGASLQFTSCDNTLEVSIRTNQGDWTFEFN